MAGQRLPITLYSVSAGQAQFMTTFFALPVKFVAIFRLRSEIGNLRKQKSCFLN